MAKGFTENDVTSQAGKTFVVTGANTGLGFHIARVLAKNGGRVLMGCRSPQKAELAKTKILTQHPSANLELITMDLGDLSSLKEAADVINKEERLDALINNAGIMTPPLQKTTEGFESQFGVNHLGTFALTAHLLDKLQSTPKARVINTSSNAHKMTGRIDWDDLNAEKGYKKFKQYALSKLANLMHIYALQRRFDQKDLSTLALAVHPGGSDTELFRGLGPLAKLMVPVSRPFVNSADEGAWPTLMAATAPSVQGGDYLGPRGFMEIKGPAVKVHPNAYAKDEAAQERLWEVSCALTGVSPDL